MIDEEELYEELKEGKYQNVVVLTGAGVSGMDIKQNIMAFSFKPT